MEKAIIAELLRPYATVAEATLDNISTYIDILIKWNSKISLTSIRDPREIVGRHFGESLFLAAKVIGSEWKGKLCDVGSGAGFPGLPVALYCAGADVTLIEAHGKKVTFLNEVIYALKLKNAKVFHGRAEDFPGGADLVVLRAVEDFERAVLSALKLIDSGGRLVLMIGRSQIEMAQQVTQSLEWDRPISVPSSKSRVALIGTKIGNVG